MGFLRVRRRTFIVIAVILILSIIANGLLLWRVIVERKRVRNSVVPISTVDYFNQQLALAERERLLQLGKHEYPDLDVLTVARDNPDVTLKADYVSQNPGYPTGCESAAAVMLLTQHEFDITLSDFVSKYLPKGEVSERGGTRFGPDPSVVYAGDPSSKDRGWGCFAPVIAGALEKIVSLSGRKDLQVEDLSGIPLYGVSTVIPAVIWVTQDYSEVKEIFQWQSVDKTQTFTFPRNEHAVLLVGQDDENYFILDPLKTEEQVAVKRSTLEKCYDSMGRQAVTIVGPDTMYFYYDELK